MKRMTLMMLTTMLAACGQSGSDVRAPAAGTNAVEVTRPVEGQTARAMQQASEAAKQGLDRTMGREDAAQVAPEAPASAPKQAEAGPAKKPVAVQAPEPSGSAQAKTATPGKAKSPEVAAPAQPEQPAADKPVATAPAGDVAKGQKLGRKCKACHNFSAKKKVGPGLAGIYGRKAGIMPDMRYGSSLAAGGWSWDDAHLAAWVCDAKEAIRAFTGDASAKTRMSAQRICDPADQADLIAWLKTL